MSTSDLIMSILAEKPLNLMSWNVTCGAGGTLAGRKAFILKVSGFKHQGAVVIFPNSLDGYFDIELIDESGEVVESVEYISACKLSEIIDQLVEVTENYSDDIVRWLRKCTPNENQIQKIASWYQLALLAADANTKFSEQKNNRPLQVELENGRS